MVEGSPLTVAGTVPDLPQLELTGFPLRLPSPEGTVETEVSSNFERRQPLAFSGWNFRVEPSSWRHSVGLSEFCGYAPPGQEA